MGYQSLAMRPQETMLPAVVATVDLEKVFNSLTEKSACDEAMKRVGDQLFAERERKADQLKQMEADLGDLAPAGPKFKELQDQTLLEAERLRAYNDYMAAKLDAERSKTLKRLYLNIRKAVDQMAQSNGYDIVLVNDSIAEIPAGNSEDMTRQISARRVLFAGSRVDITITVITYMNAEFAKQPE
jgi:Skp family chaperone for outer membrane proteins